FFSSRRRHTRFSRDWSSDVCSSDLIVQEEGMPYPSFKVFGSQLKFLHWSYRRHLERTFRETFDFMGTGIKFWWIDQHKPRVHGRSEERRVGRERRYRWESCPQRRTR